MKKVLFQVGCLVGWIANRNWEQTFPQAPSPTMTSFLLISDITQAFDETDYKKKTRDGDEDCWRRGLRRAQRSTNDTTLPILKLSFNSPPGSAHYVISTLGLCVGI